MRLWKGLLPALMLLALVAVMPAAATPVPPHLPQRPAGECARIPGRRN